MSKSYLEIPPIIKAQLDVLIASDCALLSEVARIHKKTVTPPAYKLMDRMLHDVIYCRPFEYKKEDLEIIMDLANTFVYVNPSLDAEQKRPREDLGLYFDDEFNVPFYFGFITSEFIFLAKCFNKIDNIVSSPKLEACVIDGKISPAGRKLLYDHFEKFFTEEDKKNLLSIERSSFRNIQLYYWYLLVCMRLERGRESLRILESTQGVSKKIDHAYNLATSFYTSGAFLSIVPYPDETGQDKDSAFSTSYNFMNVLSKPIRVTDKAPNPLGPDFLPVVDAKNTHSFRVYMGSFRDFLQEQIKKFDDQQDSTIQFLEVDKKTENPLSLLQDSAFYDGIAAALKLVQDPDFRPAQELITGGAIYKTTLFNLFRKLYPEHQKPNSSQLQRLGYCLLAVSQTLIAAPVKRITKKKIGKRVETKEEVRLEGVKVISEVTGVTLDGNTDGIFSRPITITLSGFIKQGFTQDTTHVKNLDWEPKVTKRIINGSSVNPEEYWMRFLGNIKKANHMNTDDLYENVFDYNGRGFTRQEITKNFTRDKKSLENFFKKAIELGEIVSYNLGTRTSLKPFKPQVTTSWTLKKKEAISEEYL